MKIPLLPKLGGILLAAALAPLLASAQEKDTLAVLDIKVIPALEEPLPADQKTELDRINESLDEKFIDSFNATRKFQLVARSDLDQILKEQNLGASGNIDPATAAKIGKLTGAKFVITATVDDFQDYVETAHFEGTGDSATKRVFRYSIEAKIYDSSNGNVRETASFQTGNNEFKQIQQEHNYSGKNGELSDEMMEEIARSMAGKIALHVEDVIFPIKVLVKDDSGVMVNRGEGGGLAVGDIFNVFAPGKKLVDPDTGEVLGNEEVNIGQVQITEVDPKFSKAKIITDNGIDAGAILRRPQ